MLVVGLTGGIGSGKSTVAELFAKKGVTIIDTDVISREVTGPDQPALKKIVEQFGPAVLAADGSLNRAQLRSVIFADETKRHWLEQLLHPLIRGETNRQIRNAQSSYCIVVIPLLFETTPNPLINRILVVDTTPELQVARTTARDKMAEEAVKPILKAQVDRNKRLRFADDVIENYSTLADLVPQVDKLHEMYCQM